MVLIVRGIWWPVVVVGCGPRPDPTQPLPWYLQDHDGDHLSFVFGDCDDEDVSIHPEHVDVPGDGIDTDCDGTDRPVTRPPHRWTPDGLAFQRAGYTMAFGADLDGDGRRELTVGAPGLFNGLTEVTAGAVYQLQDGFTDPIQEWSGATAGQHLGLVLAAGGDTDGDVRGELLLGTRTGSDHGEGVFLLRDLEDDLDRVMLEIEPGMQLIEATFADLLPGASDDEVVLVYWSGPVSVARVEIPSSGWVDVHDQDRLEFGDVPDLFVHDPTTADFDGDGRVDLLLARPDGVDRTGEVFACSSPEWSGVADGLLLCPDRWQGEHLDSHAGQALAAGGDLDGDGRTDALVGSIFYDAGELDRAGRAYVLTAPFGGGERSLADAYAHMTGEVEEDRLGQGLHGPGDLDGDGHDDVLLGAASDDEAAYNPGRVYLFLGPVASGAIDPDAAHTVFAGLGPYSEFGWEIVSGDIDGDGLTDLFFGAPYDPFEGAVFMAPGSTLF